MNRLEKIIKTEAAWGLVIAVSILAGVVILSALAVFFEHFKYSSDVLLFLILVRLCKDEIIKTVHKFKI